MSNSNRFDTPHPCNNYDIAYFEAQNFLKAAEVIRDRAQAIMFTHNGFENSLGLQYAQCVNHSFAFELLLKCISMIDDGHYFEGHNLLNLFKKLNPLTQGKIIKRFDEYQGVRRSKTYHGIFEKIEFTTVLEEAGIAFMQFRYLFEQKNITSSYDLDVPLECLEYYIHSVKPELKKKFV